jgi:outer membrane protein OmpA-like peptidoglycan-associated protein
MIVHFLRNYVADFYFFHHGGMKLNPNMKVELGGHTDAIGISKRNQSQSEERATSAKSYLVAKGIESARVETKGYSNTQPVTDNKSDASRQLNRRVDIKVITQ